MARKNGYEVGYGKPPRKHQFPKGKSGNPKGRPKGSPNFRVAIRRQLAKTAVVSEGGRRRSLTKMDIGATQLANKIAAGDLRALMVALSVPGILEGDEQKPQVLVNEDDKKVALAILARIQKAFGGGSGSGGVS
jgi:hypothetical protein